MSIAFAPSEGLTGVSNTQSPYALVERWYESDADEPSTEGISPERRALRAIAEKAMDRARSVVAGWGATDKPENLDYELPPIVIERRIRVKFRRVPPLLPPTLDVDDLPL